MSIYVRQTSELQVFKLPLATVKASFRPVDAQTHNVVKGVKMVLRGPNGSIYAKWTSKNGWKIFRPIAPGSYMLEATKVPKGYETPDEMHITIENISDMQYFELELTKKGSSGKNCGSGSPGSGSGVGSSSVGSGAKGVSSPQTGDDLNLMLLYIAIAMEMLIALAYVISRRKKHQ